MKRLGLKQATWYAILGLLVAVAILPLLKAAAPQYFPSLDGFRDLNCQGVTCPEGQFCAEGKRCVNIAVRGPVPVGNE